ncbi:ATP synthase, H+ transporting, mitochondrial F1 complex, O subunit, isoform CRA_g [Rattus norvegicus]|uniref:Oligomycin sensitivity conferral protein n=1 Tax=Rattus norvegicus TaxID=10116 RepID=A6JLI3_RAT|nr:ATP synthase, H+ transporting, mitochondrial F1 complex, O subunit, isoform CRA_g [Rattus norvegicus]
MAAPATSVLSRQVRSFSTSVVRPFSKLVRPPVQVYGIEGRYATALYSAASKQKRLDQVEKELLRVGVRSSPVGPVPTLSSVTVTGHDLKEKH